MGPVKQGTLIALAIIAVGQVGKMDLESAEVTAAIVAERDAEVMSRRPLGFPVSVDEDIVEECRREGKQFIAWRESIVVGWQYECVFAGYQPIHPL